MNQTFKTLGGAAALVFAATGAQASSLLFSLEAPGVQSSQVSGYTKTTESFDSLSTGALSDPYESAVGDYRPMVNTDPARLYPAGHLGGADGTGIYFGVIGQGTNKGTTLSFADSQSVGSANGPGQAVGYFGLWWSMLDSANELVVHMADGTSVTFDASSILSSPALQGTAGGLFDPVNGHFGNPNDFTHADAAFFFLNIYALDSKITSIDLIELVNTNTAVFESDNHTIITDYVDAAHRTGLNVFTGAPASVPVPGTALLLAPGLGLLGWSRRRQAKGQPA